MHAKLEEKIVVVANRDGGLETMEVTGMLSLRISDDALAKIRMQLHNTPNKAIQLQTHPNIDKELLKTRSQIGLKNPAKPFPLNTDVGVLKWRFQTTEESNIPLSSKFEKAEFDRNDTNVLLYFKQSTAGRPTTARAAATSTSSTSSSRPSSN